MKSIEIFFLSALFVLFVPITNSQVVPSDASGASLFIVNDFASKNQDPNLLVPNNNIIHINQIGYHNYSELNVISDNSRLNVNQGGSNNFIDLYKKSNQLIQSINQRGTNNFISDFSLKNESQINMKVNQVGNNLSLYNNGSNSISRNMKINQTGNSGSVYIFNH